MGLWCPDRGHGHCGYVFLLGKSLLPTSETARESTHTDISGYSCSLKEDEC
uniref:Uncharacterized protein n=1 Tax=Brassica oleracea TaxID=3712 RepID=A0A3P6FH59_BRAOL|nr:unnamed protein product [Brassica oleracea]